MHRFSRMHLSATDAMQKLDAIDLEEKNRVAEGIALIAVIDHRRDYLAAGYSCMRDYCVQRLHMSEGRAFRRIQVGRAALEFPELFESLADGRLGVTTASELVPHLNVESAAGLIAVGLVLWVIPGLVVAFCFALLAQVVVVEGLGGAAALRRSVEVVGSDWLRIALLLALFVALTWAARLLADLVIPDAAIFMTHLVGDLLTLVIMPLPLITAALLYLDVRRRRDGFGDENLRAVLASLRS